MKYIENFLFFAILLYIDNKDNERRTNLKKITNILKYILKYIFTLSLVFAVFFIAIQIYVDSYSRKFIFTDKNEIPSCQAIMVLGASVYSDGTPSPILKERLLYAYEMYVDKKADKIIVSGDHATTDYDEVNTMKNYLLELGVKDEDIFMDHAGFDTYDSMYRAKEVFKVSSLIISTQNFHIKRAVYIANKLGIKAYGYPCEDKEIYNMAYLNARESLAKVKAVIETDLLKRKSKLIGEEIPIWKSGTLTNDK